MDSKRAVLETYFESLDSGDFERAAEQFTEDVTYLHPPTYGKRTKIDGQEELYSYFATVRGDRELDHELSRVCADETSCGAVGYVTERGDTEPIEWFVAFAEFDGDHIEYYIAGLLGAAAFPA